MSNLARTLSQKEIPFFLFFFLSFGAQHMRECHRLLVHGLLQTFSMSARHSKKVCRPDDVPLTQDSRNSGLISYKGTNERTDGGAFLISPCARILPIEINFEIFRHSSFFPFSVSWVTHSFGDDIFLLRSDRGVRNKMGVTGRCYWHSWECQTVHPSICFYACEKQYVHHDGLVQSIPESIRKCSRISSSDRHYFVLDVLSFLSDLYSFPLMTTALTAKGGVHISRRNVKSRQNEMSDIHIGNLQGIKLYLEVTLLLFYAASWGLRIPGQGWTSGQKMRSRLAGSKRVLQSISGMSAWMSRQSSR